ncbi:MAG: FlgO family outer membrane protein [Chitinophagaceae bacterium]
MAKYFFITLFACCFLCNSSSFAQNQFDSQVKRLSDTLVKRLLKTGKKRVTVANFLDLQGNATELGKYIAEVFSVELSNSDLEVVDRSRLKDLLNELKLTEDKLTNPANALKLGEMAGVEFIITGTTTPLDNEIDISVKALDIQKGISIAGQRASIKRTDAINNLLRSTVGSGTGNTSANVNMARQVDTKDKAAMDDINETKISDLRRGECYDNSRKTYFGQLCFENQTGEDLIFAADAWGPPGITSKTGEGITLPNGTRNCSTKIIVNYPNNDGESEEIKFVFQTYGKPKILSATMRLVVEKCKLKSMVLTKKNLVLR